MTGDAQPAENVINNAFDENEKQIEINRIKLKYAQAQKLRDYAIINKPQISKETIERINKGLQTDDLISYENDLDIAITELTKETYPTTIETIDPITPLTYENSKIIDFILWLLPRASLALFFAAAAWSAGNFYHSEQQTQLDKDIFAVFESLMLISLGYLGAASYLFLNVIRVIPDQIFKRNDIVSFKTRLLLGATFGWVLYHSLTTMLQGDSEDKYRILIAFLSGFSTRLVIGFLNKIIIGIEASFGILNNGEGLTERKNN